MQARQLASEAEARGEARGRAAGLEAGRAAVEDLCEVLGLEASDERRAQLEALDLDGLRALRAHLKAHRSWP